MKNCRECEHFSEVTGYDGKQKYGCYREANVMDIVVDLPDEIINPDEAPKDCYIFDMHKEKV